MKYPEPTTDEPRIAKLELWVQEGMCESTDGCRVELDGVCEHEHPSWMLKLNLI